MNENSRSIKATISDEQIATQTNHQQRLVMPDRRQEVREIAEVSRELGPRHGPASAPGNVPRHRFVLSQFAMKEDTHG
jgi:hypothetical protein